MTETTTTGDEHLDHTIGLLVDLIEVLTVIEPRMRMNPDVIDDAERKIRGHINYLLDQEIVVDIVEHTVERLKDEGNIDALATFAFVLIDRLRHVEKWT